jgi:uncharacterized protein (TIGR02145 family)
MEKLFSVLAMPLAQPTCFVNTKHLSTGLISTLLALCVAIPAFGQSTISIHVNSGWNLLSLPASVTEGRTDSLFPTAVSPAYIFNQGSGYQRLDTLHNGPGFWLKFASEQTVVVEGDVVIRDTLVLQAGWNLIGGLSLLVPVDSIETNPPGIITADAFVYIAGQGYRRVDTLYPGFGYWVKANEGGSVVITSPKGLPCPGIPTVTYAGKTYNTVQLGSQCWLRENLDVGTMVPGSQSQVNNSTIEKYCYGDDPANCLTYGGLYQWDEAMQYDTTQGVQGICPPGWHIPARSELETLSTTVGDDGNALKAIGQGSDSGAGTNTSGFSGLLAGRHRGTFIFEHLGYWAYFWSSLESDVGNAAYLYLGSTYGGVYLNNFPRGFGLSVRCLKDDVSNLPPDAPSNPGPISGATNVSTSPTLGWSCSDPDGDPLTYDVYFGTDDPPSTIVASNQTGTTLARSGLTGGTTFYWKVVAKDNHGNSTIGPVWSFTTANMGLPCPGTPTVTYAGKTYNTVQIGSQCWLRENLDAGTMVPGSQNQANNSTIEKYCYDDDPANCLTYGGLYQWNEAMQYDTTEGIQGICPPGWHIPTHGEIQTLDSTVGGDGNALKKIGQGSGDGAGTNTSGFSALLVGARDYWGSFVGFGAYGRIWSSSEADVLGWNHLMYLDCCNGAIGSYTDPWNMGETVRCLKDGFANLPPNAPSNPSPESGAPNVTNPPTLEWSCSDPDGDPLTYDVYHGTDNPPLTIVSSNQLDTTLTRIGLTGGTTYYWKVVAKDSHGMSSAGPVWSFTTASMGYPCPGTPTVIYSGKTYNTVQIGNQCWLRENLDVGTMVLGSQEQANNGTMEKYCYDNNPTQCDTFGGLYQWNEAMQYDTTRGTRGICPPGWHMPMISEFQELSTTVGGDGNALKAVGQGSGAGAGTNTSGFSGLLAGYRGSSGNFSLGHQQAYLWSSTQYDMSLSYGLRLANTLGDIGLGSTSASFGFSIRCLKGDAPDAPSNPTPGDGATNISHPPTLEWSCSDPDGDPLTYDVYFGTDNPPLTIVSPNQTDTSLTRTGLTGGTTYHWKVVAKDNHGSSRSGPVWSFTTAPMGYPCPGTPTVTYAGKTYNTVQIESQCWLRENLDVGTRIDGSLDQANNGIIEKYCYANNSALCDTFGGLYQWNEAMQYVATGGARGICPPGWHMPTLAEFQTLSTTVGGDGNALKAIGQGTGPGAGTNTSGFSALLAGRRTYGGDIFYDLRGNAYLWTSTLLDATRAHILKLYSNISQSNLYNYFTPSGFSVRCLKD